MVLPVGQPQLWLGAGVALSPDSGDAEVTAVVIELTELLFHACSAAYCAPACAACSTWSCSEKAMPRSASGTSNPNRIGAASPNSTADVPPASRTRRARQRPQREIMVVGLRELFLALPAASDPSMCVVIAHSCITTPMQVAQDLIFV